MNISILFYLVSLARCNGAIIDYDFLGAFIPVFLLTSFVVFASGSRMFLALKKIWLKNLSKCFPFLCQFTSDGIEDVSLGDFFELQLMQLTVFKPINNKR